jgi:hypothetical protein
VKPTLTNTAMGQIAHRFGADTARRLLVTRHVHPQLAKTLRELRVQFLDTAGNAYIDNSPNLIFIQGQKRQAEKHETTEEGMLGRAGLKLVFVLLCGRKLRNQTYRDLAQTAGVGLGTAAGVLKDLTAQGYMVEHRGPQRRLIRQAELLRKWTTAYAQRLRPKNLIGRYKATRPELWRETDIERFGAQWGGEVAAQRLTHYRKPEITTIYVRRPVNNLIIDLKLRQDRNGDIELREKFWDFEKEGTDRTVVPPLLVYADLMATGDPRNIETAKMIYDDYLQRHLREE